MTSREQVPFADSLKRKTGDMTHDDLKADPDLITDDDRDQYSPKIMGQGGTDVEANINSRDSVASIPTLYSCREVSIQCIKSSGSMSSSSNEGYTNKETTQYKSRPKVSHRQHRRTKSSPNSSDLVSQLGATINVKENERNLTSSVDCQKRHPMNTSSQRSNRVRAMSYSHYCRPHYGALEGISEDDVFLMTDVPLVPSSFLDPKPIIGSHVPKLPRSELIESARVYMSQSQSHEPPNRIAIISSPGCDHDLVEEKRKVHRRQRSVEQLMEHVKGSEQSLACRDSFFALLFIFHIGLVLWIGFQYGSDALLEKTLDPNENMWVIEGTDLIITYKNVIVLACICGISSIGLSTLAFFFMTAFSTCLIQVALCLAIGLGFIWGAVGIILAPKNFVPITGIFALGLTIAYTFVVWDRIPLASTKLKVGLSTLRGRRGIILFTFAVQTLFLFWSIFFTYATIGVYDALKDRIIPSTKAGRLFCYLSLTLSYFWVFQVSIHVVQVAVAGAVKEWWFDADQLPVSSFWAKASVKSFLRACIFSFGSVCFGSLLVGIMDFLRQIADCVRPKQELLPCGHDCFIACHEISISFMRFIGSTFNQWAFIYIGLYGYSFIAAGQKATLLFTKRGWEDIVNDDLIPNILLLVSLLIGGTTGCIAVLIESTKGSKLISLENPSVTAFVIGFSIGSMLSSILFSIINSSVDAVIVCFAGSPVEFEQNHKELSHELRLAWKNVWPGSVDLVFDMNIPLNLLSSNHYAEANTGFVTL